jgi:hypothetical protein
MLQETKTKIKNWAAARSKDFKYLLIIANIIIWFMAYSSGHDFYREYILIAEGNAKEIEKEEILEDDKTSRSDIEEFYFRFENDLNFRNYVLAIKVKRNNPGNLRFVGQPHSVNNNGFAEFQSGFMGYRALIMQLSADRSRNLTLEQFMNRYAPPSENNTERLIKDAEYNLGVSRLTNIKNLDIIRFSQQITKQEHGIKY